MVESLRVTGAELDAAAARWQAISAHLTAIGVPPAITVRSQPSTAAASTIAAYVADAAQRIAARTQNTANKVRQARAGFDATEAGASGQLDDVGRLVRPR